MLVIVWVVYLYVRNTSVSLLLYGLCTVGEDKQC